MIPIDKIFAPRFKNKGVQIGNVTTFANDLKTCKLKNFAIVILGIGINVTEKTFSETRKYLYNLYQSTTPQAILDLGNIEFDEKNTEKILSKIKKQKNNLIILCQANTILSGIFPQKTNNDEKISVITQGISPKNKQITKLIKSQTYKNIAFVAFQKYFSDKNILNKLITQKYDLIRLAELRKSIANAEPALRNSNCILIDTSSVKACDGGCINSPNGLHAEELCKIANYAGLSNEITQLNIVCNEYSEISSQLTAQTIWHYIEGFFNRIYENPYKNKMQKFIVAMGNSKTNLTFYKSNLTNRWWMEVFQGNITKIVPCTYSDYQQSCSQEIPARWLFEMQKLQQHKN